MTMENAIYTTVHRHKQRFTNFYVQGRNIRFVVIPDDMDMVETMEQQLGYIKKTASRRDSSKVQAQRKKMLMKKIMEKRVQELQTQLADMSSRPTGRR